MTTEHRNEPQRPDTDHPIPRSERLADYKSGETFLADTTGARLIGHNASPYTHGATITSPDYQNRHFIFRTQDGHYFLQHRTLDPGQVDGRLEALPQHLAYIHWHDMPVQCCGFREAFPDFEVEQPAPHPRRRYFGVIAESLRAAIQKK